MAEEEKILFIVEAMGRKIFAYTNSLQSPDIPDLEVAA